MTDAALQRERLRLETAELRAEMAEQLARWASGTTSVATAIPWLSLHSRTETSMPATHVYEPNVAVILQGRKHVKVGDELFAYDESHFLLTAVDLPVSSCVVEASPDQPSGVRVSAKTIRQVDCDAGRCCLSRG